MNSQSLIVKNISPGNSPIKLENILRLMLNKPEIIYINQGLGVKLLDQKIGRQNKLKHQNPLVNFGL